MNIRMIFEHKCSKFLKGLSHRRIVSDVTIPRTSVQKIIQKYKTAKHIQNVKSRGRKRKTIIRVDRLIERKLKCDRSKPSHMAKVKLERHLGVSISERTTKRRANECVLFGRVARKLHYVNKFNRLKRLNFAKTMSNKPLDFWNIVFWTDESKFDFFWHRWKSNSLEK